MVDPYLAQRDMMLRTGQNLREAERRGLARTAVGTRKFSLSKLLGAASGKFGWYADRVGSAAGEIRTRMGPDTRTTT